MDALTIVVLVARAIIATSGAVQIYKGKTEENYARATYGAVLILVAGMH